MRNELRQFGWMVGGAFLGLAALLWWRSRGSARDVLGGVGMALFLLGTVYPLALREIHTAWLRLAHALGWLNTRLLLSVFYYAIISPVGVVMRLFGRDPLDRKWSSDQPSYWVERKEQRSRDHFEHPF